MAECGLISTRGRTMIKIPIEDKGKLKIVSDAIRIVMDPRKSRSEKAAALSIVGNGVTITSGGKRTKNGE